MKAKILVADDSVTIQKIVAMAFESEDIAVEGVGNGKQAFEKLPEIKPDVVLADTDMPGLNGYLLSKKIKESSEFGSVRVLLLASDFEDFDENLFRDSKADDHISKPFKSEEIIRKVKSLLQEGSPRGQEAEEPAVLTLSIADMIEDANLPEAIPLGAESGEESLLELSVDDIIDGVKGDIPEAVLLQDDGAGADVELTADDILNEAENLAVPIENIETEESGVFSSLGDMIAEEFNVAGAGTGVAPETARDAEEFPPMEMEFEAAGGGAGVLDEMVRDLENLKESRADDFSSRELREEPVEESLADIGRSSADALDDIDRAFKRLRSFEETPVPEKSRAPGKPGNGLEKTDASRIMRARNVEPEPENLLEKMAPSAFSRGNDLKPDLIRESLSFLSDKSADAKTEWMDDALSGDRARPLSKLPDSMEGDISQALGEHINKILRQSLGAAIQKEISGLSETILRSVKESVREAIPRIAREIIKEEIEKIKNVENA